LSFRPAVLPTVQRGAIVITVMPCQSFASLSFLKTTLPVDAGLPFFDFLFVDLGCFFFLTYSLYLLHYGFS
jgi:hypothetical protein